MIEFNSITDFELENQEHLKEWIERIILTEGFELGHILYVFCDDEYLHKLNLEFLNHDTLTDVITFDYNMGKEVNSEIFISIDRVAFNAADFDVSFNDELHRVMIHGVFHLCGYGDESAEEEKIMRSKEDLALSILLESL